MKKVTGLQTFIEAKTSGKARAFIFFLKKSKRHKIGRKYGKTLTKLQLMEAQQKIDLKYTEQKKNTKENVLKICLNKLTSILGNWWVKQFIASAPLVLAVCLFYRT